jgi:outer membrane murein-binding lipoprotein Lpp
VNKKKDKPKTSTSSRRRQISTVRQPSKQPATAKTTRRAKTMSDQRIEELEEQLEELQQKYDNLERIHNELVADLEAAAKADEAKAGDNVQPIRGQRWVRGQLPGNKYIKVDTIEGGFEEISREEWDAITPIAITR